MNTLIKTYHLIFLTDECERILEQKSYTRFNIETLSIDTVNSFVWFLLEIKKLAIFPVKVEKIFHSIPDYIEKGIQVQSDKAGQSLLLNLSEKTMDSIKDNSVKDLLKRILEKVDGEKVLSSPLDETYVSDFIKNTWQQIIYAPYLADRQGMVFRLDEIFSIIDDEDNWSKRLENLNKENLGLTGLAGLALGLLRAQSSGQRAQGTEHKAQSKTGHFQMKT